MKKYSILCDINQKIIKGEYISEESRQKTYLCLDPKIYPNSTEMYNMLNSWQKQSDKLESGEFTKEQYDEWRYKYPELDTSKHWARIPSQELSDSLLEEFRKEMDI